jgi:hypothetical protein
MFKKMVLFFGVIMVFVVFGYGLLSMPKIGDTVTLTQPVDLYWSLNQYGIDPVCTSEDNERFGIVEDSPYGQEGGKELVYQLQSLTRTSDKFENHIQVSKNCWGWIKVKDKKFIRIQK